LLSGPLSSLLYWEPIHLHYRKAEKCPPSLAVLERSGPYEIAAYILAATATYSIAKYRLKGRWPKYTSEAIVSNHIFRLTREQWIGLVLAIAILLVSNAWEAYRIMLYFAE